MWIARDKTNGILCLYNIKPTQNKEGNWSANPEGDPVKDCDYHYDYLQIDSDLFPELTWRDDPLEIYLPTFSDWLEREH